MSRKTLSVLFSLFVVLASCQTVTFKSPPGYNLKEADITGLAESLHEISGICFLGNNPDTLYAINDEDGKLFWFNLKKKKPDSVKFGKPGDYEDVTVDVDRFVVMKSNGELHSFPVNAIYSERIDSAVITKDAIPKDEYEGLFAGDGGKLFIMCKNCKGDKPSTSLRIYGLTRAPDFTYTADTIYHLDVTAVKELLAEEKKLSLHPSALAIHPLTGEWYIISSVNKLLIVADRNFKVKQAYKLKPNLFRQPEGIAFDKAGNLYVSNEGKDEDADILMFKYVRE